MLNLTNINHLIHNFTTLSRFAERPTTSAAEPRSSQPPLSGQAPNQPSQSAKKKRDNQDNENNNGGGGFLEPIIEDLQGFLRGHRRPDPLPTLAP
jgi:hypothetical protein